MASYKHVTIAGVGIRVEGLVRLKENRRKSMNLFINLVYNGDIIVPSGRLIFIVKAILIREPIKMQMVLLFYSHYTVQSTFIS